MSRRPTPPQFLTAGFRDEAFRWYRSPGTAHTGTPLRLYDGGPCCWLWQFDPHGRPCSGDLEAVHLIGRQQLRRVLRHTLVTDLFADGAIDPDDVDHLVELAEWDPRNGAPGCTGHHRRFDNHATPALPVPIAHTPMQFRWFVLDWGLEFEVEQKFSGDVSESLDWARRARDEPMLAGDGAGATEDGHGVAAESSACAVSGESDAGPGADVNGCPIFKETDR